MSSSLAAAALSVSSFALAAGGSEGGGNPIESGFKAKVLETVHRLSRMPEKARSQLKFDPDQLEAALGIPGRFEARCADLSRAGGMKRQGRMAQVFGDEPRRVYLDCVNYSNVAWQKLFASRVPADLVFFLHEALRVAGQVGEDDYGPSSSYLPAHRTARIIESALLRELVFPRRRARCRIDTLAWIHNKGSCYTCRDEYSLYQDLVIDGRTVLSLSALYWKSPSRFDSETTSAWAINWARPALIEKHLAGELDQFLEPYFDIVKSDPACSELVSLVSSEVAAGQ